MKFPRAKRRPPFVTLPRHKRSHEVFRLKGQMRRDAKEYGGRFTSWLVLNEQGRPDLYNQSFEFYFPGLDRFTFWNASIVTARKAFWDKTHNLAETRAADALTPEQLEQIAKLEFVPAERSKTGKILTYKLAKHENMRFDQFGGLTFNEQRSKLESDIIRNEPPLVHESFTIDLTYSYGIGLEIVLDVNVINQASIESAIDRFVEIGEINWISPESVHREHLPVMSEHEALEDITLPS